ncbi:MAG: HAD family phosphatase [Acidobacteria bacterium]|nr:HAD family phosphatase [Acidobacteriota bacterium]
MLRAIVFDFDGVIADSEPLHFAAFRDILAEEGVALTRDDYYARYLGFDDLEMLRAIGDDRGRGWPPGAIDRLAARKARRLETLERGGSILFPGAAEAILRASAAVPIAIASGARGDEIERVLERERLRRCFHAIVAAGDTPAGKPAPDPYLRAVALLAPAAGGALAARECVAIEDSRWGIESARGAGLRTVGVASSYAAGELGDPDLVIGSVKELDLRALATLCR